MGRLFQYNRFGGADSAANKRKKDTTSNKANANKARLLRNAMNCPAYSDIYSEYNGSAAGKNLDLAFKKCQQWSNKLPTAAEQPQATANTALSRTHKVYDSMKDFLRRKLFAPAATAVEQQQLEKAEQEEPTSDYDEHDLLDCSYQADGEGEEDELEDSCSSNSNVAATPKQRHNKSPQKSLLSLNCWQSSQHSDASLSSSDKEEDEEEEEDEEQEDYASDSDADAGISDCCQLLSASSECSSKRRQIRYNNQTDDDEENDADDEEERELLDCPWYQPRISAKNAIQHLQQATPGTFLLRRSTPSTFELCLRLERKVKQFTVQCTRNDMYKLKGAKKQFSTLKALITHHSVMAEQLPITLDMPREQHVVKCAAVRYADDFEPLETLQLLGILKSLQAKNFEI